jgi:putative ABC transport system permease protein
VGDRISIMPSVPPFRLFEFHIVSTAQKSSDPITMFGRRDYFEEELKKEQDVPQGQVSFYFVKCATKADLDEFRVKIDKFFEGSLDETKSQDEKTWMNEWVTQQFNLPRNLTILAAITVFVAIMAAANTMSMNFRDRLHEFATLKSIGFSGLFSFSLIQIESMLLCVLGGGVGAAIPYVAFTHTALKNITIPVIQTLIIDRGTCGKALGIAAVIGVVAALWPSWLVMRLNAVRALRNLE